MTKSQNIEKLIRLMALNDVSMDHVIPSFINMHSLNQSFLDHEKDELISRCKSRIMKIDLTEQIRVFDEDFNEDEMCTLINLYDSDVFKKLSSIANKILDPLYVSFCQIIEEEVAKDPPVIIKIVDKYFSPEAYATGVFDSTDMANAIEEMTTVGQKLARIKKDREDESSRSNADGIQLCPTCGKGRGR